MEVSTERDGWYIYDPFLEYRRLGERIMFIKNNIISLIFTLLFRKGLVGIPYRLYRGNCEYGLCSSYPSLFCVPSEVPDEDLVAISTFRSKGRVPAIVWRHLETNVTISQLSFD
jgi:hypothetical protein